MIGKFSKLKNKKSKNKKKATITETKVVNNITEI